MLLSFRTPRLRAHRRTLSITQVSRLAARAQLAVLGAFLIFFGYVIYVYWHALAVGGNPLAAIQRDSYAYAPHGRPYCAWRRWQRGRFSGLTGTNKTVFIAANFRNSEAVLPTFIQELPSLLAFLGPKNVYVSVYENGSNDKTRALLNLLAEALHVIGTPHTISSNDGGPESQKISGHRVAVLTGVRNKVLAPLYSSAPGTYDEVIFMNDVYHCATDVLELLYQKRAQGANQVCATDWDDYLVFDRWPLRAMSGQPFYRYEDLTNYFNTPSRDGPVPLILPHASDESDRARFTNNAPLQVFSCWNGMTAIDAAPFTSAEGPLRFRMSRADIDDQGRHRSNSEKASEAFLLDVDLWKKHMGRIALIPKASVAYSLRTYNRYRKDKLQPLATANEKIAWADRPPARLAMQDFGVWDEPERWARWDEQ